MPSAAWEKPSGNVVIFSALMAFAAQAEAEKAAKAVALAKRVFLG